MCFEMLLTPIGRVKHINNFVYKIISTYLNVLLQRITMYIAAMALTVDKNVVTTPKILKEFMKSDPIFYLSVVRWNIL